MIQIVKGLFVNMAIITSLIMFANMLMQGKYLSLTKTNIIRNGILSGIFGCLLMLFSVSITDTVIIDFRSIPVLIMALYVAPLAAIESALVIGFFRIAFFGISQASIFSLLAITLVGIFCSLIGRTSLPLKMKWPLSVIVVNSITGFSIYRVIADQQNRWNILLVYWLGMILISTFLYFFMGTLVRYNQKVDQYKEEAERDFLTGLKTPRQFERTFNEILESAESQELSVALLYIDIDHFKSINDRYGHACGDAVLKELGKMFRRMVRSQDIVSRKGGEEFVMLLVNCTLAQAEVAAERFRKNVEATGFKCHSDHPVRITLSIGVAAMPDTTKDKAQLMQLADRALYRAKQTGRNRVVVWGNE